MKIPIANALQGAQRLAMRRARLDLAAISRFTFEPVDEDRFPCLGLARSALKAGGAAPTVLNAANEIAVGAFLAGQIGFPGIFEVVEAVSSALSPRFSRAPSSVEEALTIDEEARRLARGMVPQAKAAAP
jgi:1-deoxy-D-xylulose-5-phosphate reductoisomerase